MKKSETYKVNKYQMSERYITGVLLAVVGGFLDAYTYLCRGQVFANAQTGNMILFGIHLSQGNWKRSLYYLVPIFAFVAGTTIAEIIRSRNEQVPILHWRQVVLAIECITLVVVGFLPEGAWDTLANVLVSFVCALQVQSFRKMNGKVFATTMCTGNLRSGTEHLIHYFQKRDGESIVHSMRYYGIILTFIVGAIIGAVMTNAVGCRSVWTACVGLAAVFLMLFHE